MKAFEMNDQVSNDVSPDDTKTRRLKLFYSTPTLKNYGAVNTLTKGTASVGTDQGFNNSRKNTQSDRRLKENVVHVGKHPLGIGLYLFDYKPKFRDAWGHGRQFGVMADEVEKIMPEAVSVHPDGYKMVNYAMLGISQNLH